MFQKMCTTQLATLKFQQKSLQNSFQNVEMEHLFKLSDQVSRRLEQVKILQFLKICTNFFGEKNLLVVHYLLPNLKCDEI